MIPIRRMGAGDGARAEAAVRGLGSALLEDAALLFVYPIALEEAA